MRVEGWTGMGEKGVMEVRSKLSTMCVPEPSPSAIRVGVWKDRETERERERERERDIQRDRQTYR